MVLSLTILPSLTKLPSFNSTSSFSILHSHSLNSTLILNSILLFYQFNSFSYLSPSLCLSLHYSLCNLTGILILETLSSSFPVVAQIFFAFSFLWLIKALLLVIMANLEAQRLLEHVIIDYMCKRGFHQTGEVFLREIFANQNPDAIKSLDEAFLQAWWGKFYEAYSSRFPDFPVLAAECFDKVAETVENVVANNGPANQFYSSDHTGVNISNVMPVMPSPQLMVSSPLMESSSPDPMDAMISDLMSREIPSDLQSEMNEMYGMLPFASNVGYQMPTVPPEWNARDDRPDINLGGPAQMELNNHAAANALPASPELSDAGYNGSLQQGWPSVDNVANQTLDMLKHPAPASSGEFFQLLTQADLSVNILGDTNQRIPENLTADQQIIAPRGGIVRSSGKQPAEQSRKRKTPMSSRESVEKEIATDAGFAASARTQAKRKAR
ncbi:uncharacterized protein LOC132031219 isoform X2 [Lycium ferocissimum]|uniref:uncharacterized protein LOC132031219 isoform X2 n=1 Tax=Lycium ferocissimum TaxID=112874 RepID=UPI00281615A0|nr:uncharacterized protein LOC132031219 isoform X2 [Lycium ferocissimum]